MKNQIKKILRKFEEIETLFGELTPLERDKIRELHNETGSLNYCIRWGLTACDDILKELKYKWNEELIKDQQEDFKQNNPNLIKEWEDYKPTQIKNGMDLSLNFFEWLGHIKKIDYKLKEVEK